MIFFMLFYFLKIKSNTYRIRFVLICKDSSGSIYTPTEKISKGRTVLTVPPFHACHILLSLEANMIIQQVQSPQMIVTLFLALQSTKNTLLLVVVSN